MAGLSSVFTYPAFRRGGYGGKVVAAATQAIAISDADLGMLWCSPALEAFYAKSGWVSTTSETLVGDHSHPIIEDHGGYPAVRMVLLVSGAGKAALPALNGQPVYVGPFSW